MDNSEKDKHPPKQDGPAKPSHRFSPSYCGKKPYQFPSPALDKNKNANSDQKGVDSPQTYASPQLPQLPAQSPSDSPSPQSSPSDIMERTPSIPSHEQTTITKPNLSNLSKLQGSSVGSNSSSQSRAANPDLRAVSAREKIVYPTSKEDNQMERSNEWANSASNATHRPHHLRNRSTTPQFRNLFTKEPNSNSAEFENTPSPSPASPGVRRELDTNSSDKFKYDSLSPSSAYSQSPAPSPSPPPSVTTPSPNSPSPRISPTPSSPSPSARMLVQSPQHASNGSANKSDDLNAIYSDTQRKMQQLRQRHQQMDGKKQG